MKYNQFFAFLSNQCARFAPDVDVPPEMERVLSELNRVTDLASIDPALVEPFKALLGPTYRDALAQGFLSAQAAVVERIQALDAARAQLAADREEAIKSAQLVEQEAVKRIHADREKITVLEQQIQALTGRLDALKQA